MGQLAFGVVGAVVGSVIPGVGTALGWTVGAAIGGVVFAPDGTQTVGPRLDDLKSNVSTYGQPIPRCYGQPGYMGSLMWMDEIQEQEHTEEQGKGGDPATVTTFTYSATFAVLLQRGEDAEVVNTGPVIALNRIWINEKLWYDIRDSDDVATIAASGEFARYFTFYPGNQTQEPDPTMEAILGVGNVPAYRGRAYLVFTDFPLALVQNQPPGALRIMVEVVMDGEPGGGLRFIENVPIVTGAGDSNNLLMPASVGVLRILPDSRDVIYVNTLQGDPLGSEEPTETDLQWPDAGVAGDGTYAVMRLFDGGAVRGVAGLQVSAAFLYTLTEGGGTVDALHLLPDDTQYVTSIVGSADERHVFVFTAPANNVGLTDAFHLLQWVDGDWEFVKSGTVDSANHNMTPSTGPSGQGDVYAAMAESDLRHIWWYGTGDIGFNLHTIDDDDVMTETDTIFNVGELLVAVPIQIWADHGVAYGFVGQAYQAATRNDTGAENTQTLQEVFEAETSLAGLESSQVDGSFGAGIIVEGMFVRRVEATRGTLQMLERAYFWDTVESGGVLKGKLRGSASVVTIDEDDLGASVGGKADDDLIRPERADEDSLPGECVVVYVDRASDYQVAAQHDRRSAVETGQPINLEMPLVLLPDEARQIASVWLYNQWAGRTKRTVRLSRSYSRLEPADVLTLSTSVADFTVRVAAVKTNDGFLELECVDEIAGLYSQNAEGGNIDQSTGPIQLVAPTRLVILDIPMLRESDDDGGFYIAVAGYDASWPGASILHSTDGGFTYETVASVTTSAVMGSVAAALGDYSGALGYDSVNVIQVVLFDDTSLTSCTDNELLQGANSFVLGSAVDGFEIAAFKTATFVSGRTWRLSELLRGRRGTENKMDGHGTNETFVLLDTPGMRRLDIDGSTIGEETHLKAVTFGQLATQAQTRSFDNTGAGLKPYSPINATASGFGGDVTITWTRRGRIYNDWRDGVELPLGEAVEAYSIDIYDGPTFKRTLTSATPTVVYTSANQTTDFGAPIASGDADAHIYQLSAIVGRGFPLVVNLTGV